MASYQNDDIEKRPHTELDTEKREQHVVHDNELIGDSGVTKADAMHFGQLTPEELLLEKKLRRKIDSRWWCWYGLAQL